jgi:hypothetical protein
MIDMKTHRVMDNNIVTLARFPEMPRAILHPALCKPGRVVPVQMVCTDTGDNCNIATGETHQYIPHRQYPR